MANLNLLGAAWAPRLLSVLRIVVGFLFMQHGMQKLFNFPPSPVPMPPGTMITVIGMMEFVGGLLLLIGLFTRPVAFILSGMMAVAYFMGHAIPQGNWLWPIVNQGEPAVLYCFVFLYLSAAGGGSWSVDRCIWRNSV